MNARKQPPSAALVLRPARGRDSVPKWYVADGALLVSIGCDERAKRAAKAMLAAYLRRAKRRSGNVVSRAGGSD
jgi:hypothetical protein